MKQHNAVADKRDCWGNARERERMKARFNIRQRVNNAICQEGPSVLTGTTKATKASEEVLSEYLSCIRRGDKSKFSTTFMDRHFAVVSALHSIHILETPETKSETIRQATKLRGTEYSLSLEKHMKSLLTFTLMEYAVWLGKYSIVSSMLHGGVNPCVRGKSSSLEHGSEQEYQKQQQELAKIGSKVLKRFFDSFPLRLSTYIVQSVVRMREGISNISRNDEAREEGENTFLCPICVGTICVGFRLASRSCHHEFCEMCFWNEMLSTIDSAAKHEAPNVVSCLECGEKQTCDDILLHPKKLNRELLQVDVSDLSPIERAKASLESFSRLPTNQRELKASFSTKKRLSETDHVAANWIEAVVPSLGLTQDVRLDKFQIHVERSAIVYVKGCLLAGVDINTKNEYGQTALYVAAWRGYAEVVKLLLDFGADPSVPANGGSIIYSVYSTVCHQDDMAVLELTGGCRDRTTGDDTPFMETSIQKELTYTELIPTSSNHPGAGSCFIDNALSSDNVEALLKLFHSLPIEMNQKKKKNAAPCSERSYYCDAEGSLRRLIGNAVSRSGLVSSAIPAETVDDNHPLSRSLAANSGIKSSPSSPVLRVFPHMRFLNYTSSGTVLAPHIDLCRVNPFCRTSDKQTPEHRSTHTFILYLTDCEHGGETSLLEEVTADGSAPSLTKVSPRRGRLLIFPHVTPHEGLEVVDAPKILLRGEFQINAKED